MTNLEWIAQGNTGCTFATMFARDPEKVGWVHTTYDKWMEEVNKNPCLISIEFPPDWTVKKVRQWALNTRIFLEEDVDTEGFGDAIGLRIKMIGKKSWVQYFGPDSHVITRRTPAPMLMYTRRLNPLGYFKQVGFNGIFHLAHAFANHLTDKVVDVLWNRSFEQTRKKIGKQLGNAEAAKTTWLKKDVL